MFRYKKNTTWQADPRQEIPKVSLQNLFLNIFDEIKTDNSSYKERSYPLLQIRVSFGNDPNSNPNSNDGPDTVEFIFYVKT